MLRELRAQRAQRDPPEPSPLIYFADQEHVPYGPRPLAEVRGFSIAAARFLLEQGARVIVVACNTASAAALHELRRLFPGTPFVGMEPAVKPAAEQTRSGVVGVLATPATLQGALFASVVERFAQDTVILKDTCPGLVEEIETGWLDGERARAILERALRPMLARGADTIVLGCTHYPFVIPLIQSIAGPRVRVIDPAPAVARQTARVLAGLGAPAAPADLPPVQIFTSGEPEKLERLLPMLIGEPFPVNHHRLKQ